MWNAIEKVYVLGYHGFFNKYGDPRTGKLFLMESPTSIFLILAAYLIFCLKLGPYLMRDRKPFQLKSVLVVYNFINVVLNIWFVTRTLNTGIMSYNLLCDPIDYSNNPDAVKIVYLGHSLMLIKAVELFDTVFFVLRKKHNQRSFLHVYHHCFALLIGWLMVKIFAGGHCILPCLINACIHIVMYGYNLLSALGPGMQKYLWWEKYITKMQLIQFVIIIVHQGQVLINGCLISKMIPWILTLNSLFFFILFSRFYDQTYVSEKSKSVKMK